MKKTLVVSRISFNEAWVFEGPTLSIYYTLIPLSFQEDTRLNCTNEYTVTYWMIDIIEEIDIKVV